MSGSTLRHTRRITRSRDGVPGNGARLLSASAAALLFGASGIVAGGTSASAAAATSPVSVTLTSNVSEVPEIPTDNDPVFTITVKNTGSEPVSVTKIDMGDYELAPDDTLIGVPTTCQAPKTVGAGSSYSCTFDYPARGKANTTSTTSVQVTTQDASGASTTTQASAGIRITDVQPWLGLGVWGQPLETTAPDGTVDLMIVLNASLPYDSTYVRSLVLDGYGDLLDPTNPAVVSMSPECKAGMLLDTQSSTECDATVKLAGLTPGTTSLKLTGTASDDEGNVVTANDTVQINVAGDPNATPTPTTSPSPTGSATPTAPSTSPTTSTPTAPATSPTPTSPSTSPTTSKPPVVTTHTAAWYATHTSAWSGTKVVVGRRTVTLRPTTTISSLFALPSKCSALGHSTVQAVLAGSVKARSCVDETSLVRETLTAALNEAHVAAFPAKSAAAVISDTQRVLAKRSVTAERARVKLLAAWNAKRA